jgi:hypothetical protein
LAGGGVVVVGVVVVLLFVFGVFGGSGSTSSPDAVAQTVADALNTQNNSKADAISCDGKDSPTDNDSLQQLKNSKVKATVTGKAQVNGSKATATIHLNFQEEGHTVDIDGILQMQQQSGKWCVPADGFQPDTKSMKVDGQDPGDFDGGGAGSSGSSGDNGIPDTDLPGDGGGSDGFSTPPTS